MNRRLRLFILTLLAAVLAAGSETASAKDPSQTILWPDQGPSLVRFTFGKFKEVGSLGSERTYMVETTAENLWSKKIADASFTLYLFDKNKVRIGSALLSVSNVAPGEMIKFQTTVAASGPPVSLSVTANSLPKELAPMAPAKTISITVNTVPQGSVAKLDGQEFGTTPKMVRVTVGKHLLEFSKEGFNPGKFPFEIGPDDVSGGSVSFELGTSAHDTIELRDGSVLSGDLVSVSGMEVVIRIGGSEQRFDRNQIQRVLFVQRQPPEHANQ